MTICKNSTAVTNLTAATSGCLLVVLLVHDSFGLTRVFERALVVTVVVSGDLGYPVPVGGPQKVNVGQCATEH